MTTILKHTYVLRAIEIVEFSSYIKKKFLVVARASDLLAQAANPLPRTVLPIQENLRDPSSKNVAVRSILKSIESNLFHEISAPIQIACSSVRIVEGLPSPDSPNVKYLLVEFDNETDGVLDGAHRLHALWLAKLNGFSLDNVRVTLMISEGVDIKAKCVELNTYSAPTKIALIDKNGGFDHIKALYADSFPFIRYRDNESGTSDYPLCAVKNVEKLIERAIGKGGGAALFSKNRKSPLETGSKDLLQAVNKDPEYWGLLHDIYPMLVFLFELLEKVAIAQESRFVTVPTKPSLYPQLMDGRKFAVKVASQQLIYLLMSALSVNFNQETGKWNVPLKKIGKKLIQSAWGEFKTKHTQVRFNGSASAVIADPRMSDLILAAADQAYAKYTDNLDQPMVA
jgi:hypothetical protein